MPRYIFQPDAVTTAGRPVPCTFYLSSSTPVRVTDLYRIDEFDNLDESISNGVVVADASSGSVGVFAGPDDINALYIQPGNDVGSRVLVSADRSSEVQPSPGGGEEGEIPTTRTITAGTGLTGGGDLSTDRTLSVDFGTATGTVPHGNDSRFTNSRTPTAHASSHVSAGSDPLTLGQSQVTGLVSGLVAKADLVGGKVPSAQLPSIAAGGATFVVASQAAQVALSSAVVGDVAVRSDENKSYILASAPYSTFANWVELVGTGAITSVNGYTGTVVLAASDVAAVPTTRTITAGTGLTGGGDLSANRTLSPDFGTAAGKVSEGNHAHAGESITSGTVAAARLPVIGIASACAGTNVTVFKSGGVWPARPTSRTDIVVIWNGADPSPAIVSSGTGGMLDDVDKREIPAA